VKITLDTRFNGSLGPTTLREAVQQLKLRELAVTVPAELVEGKAAAFSECVERGFTPLRSEIMAAFYIAERDAALDAFDHGLITEVELNQKNLALERRLSG
jgi:hypothetical protein